MLYGTQCFKSNVYSFESLLLLIDAELIVTPPVCPGPSCTKLTLHANVNNPSLVNWGGFPLAYVGSNRYTVQLQFTNAAQGVVSDLITLEIKVVDCNQATYFKIEYFSEAPLDGDIAVNLNLAGIGGTLSQDKDTFAQNVPI